MILGWSENDNQFQIYYRNKLMELKREWLDSDGIWVPVFTYCSNLEDVRNNFKRVGYIIIEDSGDK